MSTIHKPDKFDKNSRKVEFVVARYNEDVSWIKNHPEHFFIVYTKTPCDLKSDNAVIVPIEKDDYGKDASTYLKHVIWNYNELTDFTVFIQGRYDDHCKDLFNRLDFSKPFSWLGDLPLSTRSDGVPHNFPEIKAVYEELFKEPCPHEVFFYWGSMFMVSRKAICRAPKDFYEYILNFFSKTVKKWSYSDDCAWTCHTERYLDRIFLGRCLTKNE